MRFLLIAMLSLAAWFGPVSAQAADLQPPLVITAVSLWGKPVTPGAELDPSDPQLGDKIATILLFIFSTDGAPVGPDQFQQFTQLGLETFLPEATSSDVRTVKVPQFGLGSQAASGIDGGSIYDVIFAYDEDFRYALISGSNSSSPSSMGLLQDIAAQTFDPSRPAPPYTLMTLFVDQVAPEGGYSHEALLSLLPGPDEVPADFQLLGEEVIVY